MKVYKYILGIMAFGYITYWIAALLGIFPIAQSNNNEFAYEWSYAVIDPLVAVMYIISLYLYIKKYNKWRVVLTAAFAISIGINLQTMLYWIILVNFSNPMWLMALFVFFYSLIGLFIINKD